MREAKIESKLHNKIIEDERTRLCVPLAFPAAEVHLQYNYNRWQIFDVVRRQWCSLTPEEWVRQHLILFLNRQHDYPLSLMQTECGLKVNGMSSRADLIVYNRAGNPWLLAECKAPLVKVSQAVVEQVARYNTTLHSPWLLVTNGHELLCCHINKQAQSVSWVGELPAYEQKGL